MAVKMIPAPDDREPGHVLLTDGSGNPYISAWPKTFWKRFCLLKFWLECNAHYSGHGAPLKW